VRGIPPGVVISPKWGYPRDSTRQTVRCETKSCLGLGFGWGTFGPQTVFIEIKQHFSVLTNPVRASIDQFVVQCDQFVV
jgi:hypothetical protein